MLDPLKILNRGEVFIGEANTDHASWSEMSDFSLGLPDTCPLNERKFLVVYYAGPQRDLTSVQWAKIGL